MPHYRHQFWRCPLATPLFETAYPVTLTSDEKDGGFVVTFKDFPEAITQGETTEEALVEAADALDEAIAGRLQRGDPIPVPSPTTGLTVIPAPSDSERAKQ
jgi:antitoxin HicB